MRNQGFTLIEMMLSIATIGVIATISIPIYQSLQVRNDLDVVAVEVVHSLRRAKVLSQSVDGDISWGVKVQSGSATVFKGASYSSRDTTLDEIFEIPTSITPSGLLEIVFEKFTGTPQSIGTITLTSSANETRTITINNKGTISY